MSDEREEIPLMNLPIWYALDTGAEIQALLQEIAPLLSPMPTLIYRPGGKAGGHTDWAEMYNENRRIALEWEAKFKAIEARHTPRLLLAAVMYLSDQLNNRAISCSVCGYRSRTRST
jgi:hypothetical protein